MPQWIAQLKNSILIPQFPLVGKEILFSDVLEAEKQDKLAMLHVSVRDHNFAVDLEDGLFYMDDVVIDMRSDLVKKQTEPKFRVIFYRRKRRISGATIGEPFIYALLLGWQITIDGENHQRIMFIYPENHGVRIEFKEKR